MHVCHLFKWCLNDKTHEALLWNYKQLNKKIFVFLQQSIKNILFTKFRSCAILSFRIFYYFIYYGISKCSLFKLKIVSLRNKYAKRTFIYAYLILSSYYYLFLFISSSNEEVREKETTNVPMGFLSLNYVM